MTKVAIGVPAGIVLAGMPFNNVFAGSLDAEQYLVPDPSSELLLDKIINGNVTMGTDGKPLWDGKGRLRLTGFKDQPSFDNWGKESYFIQINDDNLLIAGDRERVDGWEPSSLIAALKTYNRPDMVATRMRPIRHGSNLSISTGTVDEGGIQTGVTRFDPLSRIVSSANDPNYLKFQFAGPADFAGPLYWWDNADKDRLMVQKASDIALNTVPTRKLFSPSIAYDAEWMLRTAFVELGDHSILGIRPVQSTIPDAPASTRTYRLFAYKVEPDAQGRHGLGPARLGLMANLIIEGDQGFLTTDHEGMNTLEQKIIQAGFNPPDFITRDPAKISFGGINEDTSLSRLYGVTNNGQNDSVLNLSRKRTDPTSLLPIAFGHNPTTYGRAQWVDRST